MQIETRIIELLSFAFKPVHLSVINESYRHNVPQGAESHFKVTIVADDFEGKRLIQRHRMINKELLELLASSVHALALHTYTPSEWAKETGIPASPPCRGGELQVKA